MDRTVLDLYGWTDIPTNCDFLLDYEIDETTWGAKKKPYRYRWPDEVRDEVLGRLLALNTQRAGEEAREGERSGNRRPPTTVRSRTQYVPTMAADEARRLLGRSGTPTRRNRSPDCAASA